MSRGRRYRKPPDGSVGNSKPKRRHEGDSRARTPEAERGSGRNWRRRMRAASPLPPRAASLPDAQGCSWRSRKASAARTESAAPAGPQGGDAPASTPAAARPGCSHKDVDPPQPPQPQQQLSQKSKPPPTLSPPVVQSSLPPLGVISTPPPPPAVQPGCTWRSRQALARLRAGMASSDEYNNKEMIERGRQQVFAAYALLDRERRKLDIVLWQSVGWPSNYQGVQDIGVFKTNQDIALRQYMTEWENVNLFTSNELARKGWAFASRIFSRAWVKISREERRREAKEIVANRGTSTSAARSLPDVHDVRISMVQEVDSSMLEIMLRPEKALERKLDDVLWAKAGLPVRDNGIQDLRAYEKMKESAVGTFRVYWEKNERRVVSVSNACSIFLEVWTRGKLCARRRKAQDIERVNAGRAANLEEDAPSLRGATKRIAEENISPSDHTAKKMKCLCSNDGKGELKTEDMEVGSCAERSDGASELKTASPVAVERVNPHVHAVAAPSLSAAKSNSHVFFLEDEESLADDKDLLNRTGMKVEENTGCLPEAAHQAIPVLLSPTCRSVTSVELHPERNRGTQNEVPVAETRPINKVCAIDEACVNGMACVIHDPIPMCMLARRETTGETADIVTGNFSTAPHSDVTAPAASAAQVLSVVPCAPAPPPMEATTILASTEPAVMSHTKAEPMAAVRAKEKPLDSLGAKVQPAIATQALSGAPAVLEAAAAAAFAAADAAEAARRAMDAAYVMVSAANVSTGADASTLEAAREQARRGERALSDAVRRPRQDVGSMGGSAVAAAVVPRTRRLATGWMNRG